jgi:4-amino-4-deoxy-L-arabinose transferase-like glycosyltransferase
MILSPIASKLGSILLAIIVMALAFCNIFYRLSDFPIFSWDEARHGVNAYEMLKRGNFVVNTYNNKVDYWNLKPPLSFLLTIAGYKIAGFNTLGLRILSAISAFLTILVVFFFSLRKHGLLAAFISALSLVTSTQFLINHSARTADADSFYVLLFTSSIIALLLSEQSTKWLFVSMFSFSLSFLTKSWHAGSIFVIILLYLLFSGGYKPISQKSWIVLFTCMAAPVLIWAGIRYQYDGIEFFKKMITYDLLKRSSTPIEGHIGSKLYYFETLWSYSRYWVILLITCFLFYVVSNFKRIKPTCYTLGLILWLFIPLILYSMAETKIRWYILPIYPVLSIFIGALCANILQRYRIGVKLALLISIVLISFHYERNILSYIQHPAPKLHLDLLQKIQTINKAKGSDLYIYPHIKGVWTQNTVLAAELYGDLKVKSGGVRTFLKNDNALLMLKKDKRTKQLLKSNHLTIITSNKWGYIVRKSK